MEKYDRISYLGKGAYGFVYKYRRKADGQVFACKSILFKDEQRHQDAALQEYNILSKLKHPNIVSYVEIVWEPSVAQIFMSLCEGGSLADFIDSRESSGGPVSERYVSSIFSQLASALLYCHHGITVRPDGTTMGSFYDWDPILHRDIKPGNILLSTSFEEGNVVAKLGDFGLSTFIDFDKAPSTYAGTKEYLAPEISRSTRGRNHWTKMCDIFSLGCSMWELVNLVAPFSGHMDDHDEYKDLPQGYSDKLNKRIAACMSISPYQRPDASDLMRSLRRYQQEMGYHVEKRSVSTSPAVTLTKSPELEDAEAHSMRPALVPDTEDVLAAASASATSATSSSVSVPPSHSAGNIVSRMQALYDFTPSLPGDLNFKRGDIIDVLETINSNWYRGTLNGQTGIVPVNFVQPFETAHQASNLAHANDAKDGETEAETYNRDLNRIGATTPQPSTDHSYTSARKHKPLPTRPRDDADQEPDVSRARPNVSLPDLQPLAHRWTILIKTVTPTKTLSLPVSVDPGCTIQDIKHQIEQITKIPWESQLLVFNKRYLMNKATARSYGIQDGSVVELELSSTSSLAIAELVSQGNASAGTTISRPTPPPITAAQSEDRLQFENAPEPRWQHSKSGGSRTSRGLVQMDFIVQTLTGKTINVRVSSRGTILDIKKAVEDSEGIPVDQQRLVSGGRQLEDAQSIQSYGLQNGITIHLILRLQATSNSSSRQTPFGPYSQRSPPQMEFFVKTLTGKTVNVKVSSRGTVLDIKEAIEDREGIPVDQQRLIYSGRQLEDTQSIQSYDLQDGVTMHLVLRLRDTSNSTSSENKPKQKKGLFRRFLG